MAAKTVVLFRDDTQSGGYVSRSETRQTSRSAADRGRRKPRRPWTTSHAPGNDDARVR